MGLYATALRASICASSTNSIPTFSPTSGRASQQSLAQTSSSWFPPHRLRTRTPLVSNSCLLSSGDDVDVSYCSSHALMPDSQLPTEHTQSEIRSQSSPINRPLLDGEPHFKSSQAHSEANPWIKYCPRYRACCSLHPSFQPPTGTLTTEPQAGDATPSSQQTALVTQKNTARQPSPCYRRGLPLTGWQRHPVRAPLSARGVCASSAAQPVE